jgi:UDP-N-acetylglucosamine transferase subunit ALG13
MIFITVGTDQPFDRMMRIVDKWARENNRSDVFAQIGEGGWEPKFIPHATLLEPAEFKKRFAAATLIIAHAGMGTILSALLQGKPILVMPKKASLGEHRNEHQLATARHMQAMGHVSVAFDEAELLASLNHLGELPSRKSIGPFASESLITAIRDYIFSKK